MASVSVSIAAGVLTFGVGLLGLYLKRLVPRALRLATSYSGYRFPPEIIQQAIWLYLRFTVE